MCFRWFSGQNFMEFNIVKELKSKILKRQLMNLPDLLLCLIRILFISNYIVLIFSNILTESNKKGSFYFVFETSFSPPSIAKSPLPLALTEASRSSFTRTVKLKLSIHSNRKNISSLRTIVCIYNLKKR